MVARPGKSAKNPAGRSPRAARLTREDPVVEGRGTATPPLVALQEMKLMKLLLQRCELSYPKTEHRKGLGNPF